MMLLPYGLYFHTNDQTILLYRWQPSSSSHSFKVNSWYFIYQSLAGWMVSGVALRVPIVRQESFFLLFLKISSRRSLENVKDTWLWGHTIWLSRTRKLSVLLSATHNYSMQTEDPASASTCVDYLIPQANQVGVQTAHLFLHKTSASSMREPLVANHRSTDRPTGKGGDEQTTRQPDNLN